MNDDETGGRVDPKTLYHPVNHIAVLSYNRGNFLNWAERWARAFEKNKGTIFYPHHGRVTLDYGNGRIDRCIYVGDLLAVQGQELSDIIFLDGWRYSDLFMQHYYEFGTVLVNLRKANKHRATVIARIINKAMEDRAREVHDEKLQAEKQDLLGATRKSRFEYRGTLSTGGSFTRSPEV